MYRGFKLNINNNIFKSLTVTKPELKDSIFESLKDYNYYHKRGEEMFDKYAFDVYDNLELYIKGDSGIIDGTKLQNDWFPQINCDIFISHSHKDEDLAIALAGWLYDRFQLKSFIDSCIWHYADDLLEIIDNKYCLSSDHSYNYRSRNYSTSHVHMMLNMALMQMIDKTECLFFLNTPNSIDLSDIKTRTLSPWIYSEIGISKMINKHIKRTSIFSKLDESLGISYNLDLSHLANISQQNLKSWGQQNIYGNDSLDWLYETIKAPLKQ